MKKERKLALAILWSKTHSRNWMCGTSTPRVSGPLPPLGNLQRLVLRYIQGFNVLQSVDFGNISIVILPFNCWHILQHTNSVSSGIMWLPVFIKHSAWIWKEELLMWVGFSANLFSVIRYLQILIEPKRGVLGLKSIRMTSNPILHPFWSFSYIGHLEVALLLTRVSIWIFRPPWNSCLRSFVLCESQHLTVRWWAHGSKGAVSNLYSNGLSWPASKVSLRDYIFASNLVQLPLSSKIHSSLKFPSVQSDGNVELSVFFIHDLRDGHVDSCNAVCPYLFHQRVLLSIILSLSKKYLHGSADTFSNSISLIT